MKTVVAPPAARLVAMNCDEPANTRADIPAAPAGEKPLLTANAPKMIPKGIAPTTRGIVALAPAQNSVRARGFNDVGLHAFSF